MTIGAPPGAEVHVAFGGWEPTEADPLYEGPVPTGAQGDAVVVRARAWQDGYWPSRIATATYLLQEPGRLPIVSLVTNPPNLWDEEIGIYVYGTNYDEEPPFVGANFWESWERPVHVEHWEPNGVLAYRVDAGVQIHGGYTRTHEQKSLLVELGGGWGPGEIAHEVFPGLGIESFDRLLLRAGGNDWHGCGATGCVEGALLRDGLAHALTAGVDLDVMAWRPAEVYLNGEYWGIYHLNERPDLSYVEAHHGEDEIDLLENHSQPVEGDEIAYQELLEWLRTHDLSDPENYAHLGTLIEIDELQNYLIFEIFYDNGDWPGNNIKFWRPRDGDGRWRWMLYDTDLGLGLYGESPTNDTLAVALDPAGPEWPNPPWSTELLRLLVRSPEFTESFVNRYADFLNTLLVPEVTEAKLREFGDQIALEVPRHIARWGTWSDGVTTYQVDEGAWDGEIEWIATWLDRRPDEARAHVVRNFGLEGTFTLELATDPPGAGTFALHAVTVDAPFTGVYFRGVPVTITAIPAPGYTFVDWSDPTLPAEATVTVDPDAALSLTARFE